jgi:hypothetical protein
MQAVLRRWAEYAEPKKRIHEKDLQHISSLEEEWLKEAARVNP